MAMLLHEDRRTVEIDAAERCDRRILNKIVEVY